MPTLAAPRLDAGVDRRSKALWEKHPLAVGAGAAISGFIVVLTVVVLVGGGGTNAVGAPSEKAAAAASPAVEVEVRPPSAVVERPDDVQQEASTLARQFLRELLTRPPGETSAETVDRLRPLLTTSFAEKLAAADLGDPRLGTLVEIGATTQRSPGELEAAVRPWTYRPGEKAVRRDHEAWEVHVERNAGGKWVVVEARAS